MKKYDLMKTKSPPLRTMDRNLMFSQRNNPYCDLLKISAAKINFFYEYTKCFKRNLYFCGKITKIADYEEDSWPRFRHK